MPGLHLNPDEKAKIGQILADWRREESDPGLNTLDEVDEAARDIWGDAWDSRVEGRRRAQNVGEDAVVAKEVSVPSSARASGRAARVTADEERKASGRSGEGAGRAPSTPRMKRKRPGKDGDAAVVGGGKPSALQLRLNAEAGRLRAELEYLRRQLQKVRAENKQLEHKLGIMEAQHKEAEQAGQSQHAVILRLRRQEDVEDE